MFIHFIHKIKNQLSAIINNLKLELYGLFGLIQGFLMVFYVQIEKTYVLF